jgi:probable phosphoglycerate mutase
MITTLPIQTIYSSPMLRAQETKEIIMTQLQVESHHIIEDLGECSMKIWRDMVALGIHASPPLEGEVAFFMDRVRRALNQALSFSAPPLIVAHGGVHWATCCLMGIKGHDWEIENCAVVHFSIGDQGEWIAKKLTVEEQLP